MFPHFDEDSTDLEPLYHQYICQEKAKGDGVNISFSVMKIGAEISGSS